MSIKKNTLVKLIAIGVLLVAVIVLAAVLRTDVDGADSMYFATFMSLVPPVIAIALALVTKEVYSSLFIGIVAGALFATNYNPVKAMDVVIADGLIGAVEAQAGIFVFLVVLGIMVALINKAGGSRAFGEWAKDHIKTKVGAMIATFVLGVLIFIDDYFNCLTVGSVMSPLTDSHKISRVKLAYLIDATAAPICMIAPISSWAAAVNEFTPEGYDGLMLFISAIPYNFYSLLTLVFIVAIAIMGFDYGKMADFEIKAQGGDFSVLPGTEEKAEEGLSKRSIFDLILPIIVLIVACVLALLYVGEMFTADSEYYMNFAGAFGNTDATVALPWGSIIALVFTIAYYVIRNKVTKGEAGIDFELSMKAVPQGFIAMVPAILILTFATGLKNVTGLLGSDMFIENALANAETLQKFLPAIIFLVACLLAFATGTSWGTFGILIPIVISVFAPGGAAFNELATIGMSACLAGAVCGDHCSPISDTTIMSSAGAKCNHVDHVSTQIPYAVTVAAISFVCFLLAGFIQSWFIVLPIGILLTVGTLFGLRYILTKKAA